MSTSEPEGWSFSNTKFKVYDSGTSSSDDSSDDEDIFSKTKSINKKKFKKIVEKEDLLPE
jgi:hypothetical protein